MDYCLEEEDYFLQSCSTNNQAASQEQHLYIRQTRNMHLFEKHFVTKNPHLQEGLFMRGRFCQADISNLSGGCFKRRKQQQSSLPAAQNDQVASCLLAVIGFNSLSCISITSQENTAM